MSNILLINGHPKPKASLAGRAVIESLRERCPGIIVRHLADVVGPFGRFFVGPEQEALAKADVVVWHFPLYWFSVPALMKSWMDGVFAPSDWSAEPGHLAGKPLVLSMTAGAPEALFASGARMGHAMSAFLPSLMQTARLCGMEPLEPVWSCGMTPVGLDGRAAVLARARNHAERIAERLRPFGLCAAPV